MQRAHLSRCPARRGAGVGRHRTPHRCCVRCARRAERELDQRWARNMMLNKWLEYCVERGHRFSPATRIAREPVQMWRARRRIIHEGYSTARVSEAPGPCRRRRTQEDDASSRCSAIAPSSRKPTASCRTRSTASRTASSSRKAPRSACRKCSARSSSASARRRAGYPALVFYQLRRFWQPGRELIEQFVADLARQLEERERRALLRRSTTAASSRGARRSRRELRAAETDAADARSAARASCRPTAPALTRFWHYFKRRALDRAHRRLRKRRSAATESALAERARGAWRRSKKRPAPGFPGLSVEARRAINLAAIAYAEALCLRLVKTPLVTHGSRSDRPPRSRAMTTARARSARR